MCDADSPRDTRQWILIIISLCSLSLSSFLSLCFPSFLNNDLEEETSKLEDSHRGSRHQWRAHERLQYNAQALCPTRLGRRTNPTILKERNLPNDWSEGDAPLQSFGVKQDSLKEYDGVVNTKWWSVGMIEEHGGWNGHEKKPNENYGRDKTVIWWVELVILHMLLLNDVQKIVMVPQIHYIAVCDATTNSPKLQECLDTADMCSKSMEWSMFLSWCRSSFSPFKTKKKLSASLYFVLFIVLLFQKMTHWENCGTLFSFLLTKMFFACALCCWSLCCGFAIVCWNFHWQEQNSTEKLVDVFFFLQKNLMFISFETLFFSSCFTFFVIFHGQLFVLWSQWHGHRPRVIRWRQAVSFLVSSSFLVFIVFCFSSFSLFLLHSL